jgi:hypothetical protein
MKVWELSEVKKNPFDKRADTDPDAIYSITISEQGSYWSTRSGITYRELMPILSHFKVNRPEDLTGKTFTNTRESATSALNLLIVEISHGGEYTPPSEESLHERAIVALGNMQCPDFSDVDDETVYNAFRKAFNGSRIDEKWLCWFQKRISTSSNGRVQLQKANIDEFSMRVMGPAEYLILAADERRQRVILGPYSRPVSFD